MPYNKILIANRGEIACRIIRTARRMGISCVCIYSDADAYSLHTMQADETKYVGPAPSYLSYLNIDKICEIALETNSQAVHPGYGFLAENPDFPRALQRYNINFIGPSAETIEMTANKIKAKEVAQKAGVNVVPGYSDKIDNIDHAIEIAKKIGFPVMLKAAAGGGGKGMRVVKSEGEIAAVFISATNEAEKSFNDGTIFIEKYITFPRHIEIQIIADKYGNVVCLGERECSIQRNNQKIIEETPSPFMNQQVREKMYGQCIALAKQVGYFNAGTVEFVVDQDHNFYFLEVNTRLQVEHPITEFVTGIDIVEEMFRISAGERLSFNQDDIKLKGSAIEARICAEDPSRCFFPSSGRIKYYDKPNENEYLRIDDGVSAGSEVSIFYDSMIAKVISYGQDRVEAISRMQKALSEYYVGGIVNNIEFLESIFHHPNFIAGTFNTGFISDFYPGGFHGDFVTEESIKIFIFASLYIYSEYEYKYQAFIVVINNNKYAVNVEYEDDKLTIIYNHNRYLVKGRWRLSSYKLLNIMINGEIDITVKVDQLSNRYFITYAGMRCECQVFNPHTYSLNKFMLNNDNSKKILEKTNTVQSPISGLLTKLYVNIDDQIEIGQPLFIIEAMKMENAIHSEINAVVKNILIEEGKSVKAGEVILGIE